MNLLPALQFDNPIYVPTEHYERRNDDPRTGELHLHEHHEAATSTHEPIQQDEELNVVSHCDQRVDEAVSDAWTRDAQHLDAYGPMLSASCNTIFFVESRGEGTSDQTAGTHLRMPAECSSGLAYCMTST